jgi:transcriptional regulator with XRE-family HTH domain
MIGERIRQARLARRLSLSDVAKRIDVSVSTLSRVERDKQGLDLGMFLSLCRVLHTSPHELLGEEAGDHVDPLAIRIAALGHGERMQLWHDLAASRREERRVTVHKRIRKLSDEVEELIAQLEFVHTEMESVRARVRRR